MTDHFTCTVMASNKPTDNCGGYFEMTLELFQPHTKLIRRCHETPQGKRKQGRPRNKWRQELTRDTAHT